MQDSSISNKYRSNSNGQKRKLKMRGKSMDTMPFYFGIDYFGNGKHPISQIKESIKEKNIIEANNFKSNNEGEKNK